MRRHTRTFHAMGSDCHISVYSDRNPDALTALGETRTHLLEAAWSRFRPDSEISHLNRTAGHGPVPVTPDTHLLLRRLLDAYRLTGGLFTPEVGGALTVNGYDRSLDAVHWSLDLPTPRPVVEEEPFTLHPDGTVTLLPDVTLDPGGLGKGLAADIVARELAAAAAAVIVNLGGDVVLTGQPGKPEWVIAATHRAHHGDNPTFTVPTGSTVAAATSGVRTRQWGPHLHHLIDPATGLPAHSPTSDITVLDSEGWRAEAHTKAALLSADAAAYLKQHHLTGALTLTSGRHITVTEATT